MAGLAVVMVGMTTGAIGFAVGIAATATVVLLGPRVANLVSHWTCAATLLVLGSTAWSYGWSQIDFDAPSSPGDLSQVIAQVCIVTATAGYAIACVSGLGANILWNSAVPGARDCARLLLAAPIVILLLIFGRV
jgi:hypothetical protein